MAVDETLEAMIDASPVASSFLVYGDWLQAQGDPRGELVAVQAAQLSARGMELARLKTRESELLESYADQLYGAELASSTSCARSTSTSDGSACRRPSTTWISPGAG